MTDTGIGYREKLTLISQARVTLVHNILFPTPKHQLSVLRHRGYRGNEAFEDFPRIPRPLRLEKREVHAPQIKSRAFEAAFCRSLILCRRDRWNLIERFFEPEREFIYFDEGGLEQALDQILGDFAAYEPVIERAHQRAVSSYTTPAFVERFLKDI